ncbi:MAG: DUF177 domain-containing protein [Patescibacteria group bacterium]
MFTYDVGGFLHKRQGSKIEFEMDESLILPPADEIFLIEHVKSDVLFLKLPHEIHVQLTDLTTAAQSRCNRCLENFTLPIIVPTATREFILDLEQRDLAPDEEVFYVDRHTHGLNLYDMVRQEILLHFPAVPICSDGCKGLCDRCGSNLNLKMCDCPAATSPAAMKIIF